MVRFWLLLVLTVLSIVKVFGQTNRNTNRRGPDSKLPSALATSKPASFAYPKKKKKEMGLTYKARENYEKRTERMLNERSKRELSGSASWNKPNYFGHKRSPRIRPAAKHKYCKVCGIRH